MKAVVSKFVSGLLLVLFAGVARAAAITPSDNSTIFTRPRARRTVAPLVGCTVPYVYVGSLDEAKLRLEPSAMVVEEKATADGTREAVVVQHGQFMILAEKVE